MASPIIYAGQDLQAGQNPGQLSQYYSYSDTNVTTVTAASFTTLSTLYDIPANEPYLDAEYELLARGFGSWASTSGQQLTFAMAFNGTQEGNTPAIAAATFAAGASFAWWLRISATCNDGVSGWDAAIEGGINQTANPINPGTASTNSSSIVGVTASGFTKAISSAISVCVQAKWASTTGAPSITCFKTRWSKVSLWGRCCTG